MVIYWLNVFILIGSFVMSLFLFLTLFESDSVAYTLNNTQRAILKTGLIMLCIGQLHAMDGDSFKEVDLHDLIRDIGQFVLIFYVHYYLIQKKRKSENL